MLFLTCMTFFLFIFLNTEDTLNVWVQTILDHIGFHYGQKSHTGLKQHESQ